MLSSDIFLEYNELSWLCWVRDSAASVKAPGCLKKLKFDIYSHLTLKFDIHYKRIAMEKQQCFIFSVGVESQSLHNAYSCSDILRAWNHLIRRQRFVEIYCRRRQWNARGSSRKASILLEFDQIWIFRTDYHKSPQMSRKSAQWESSSYMSKTDRRGGVNRRFSRHKRRSLENNKLVLYKEVAGVLTTKQNTRTHTHTHTHSHTHTLSHSNSHTHIHTHSYSHTLTHTHT